MSQLFSRKPIADLLPEGEQPLRRVLGAGDLVMLSTRGLGAVSSQSTARPQAGECCDGRRATARPGAGPLSCARVRVRPRALCYRARVADSASRERVCLSSPLAS